MSINTTLLSYITKYYTTHYNLFLFNEVKYNVKASLPPEGDGFGTLDRFKPTGVCSLG